VTYALVAIVGVGVAVLAIVWMRPIKSASESSLMVVLLHRWLVSQLPDTRRRSIEEFPQTSSVLNFRALLTEAAAPVVPLRRND
jgi:hypothetical protein